MKTYVPLAIVPLVLGAQVISADMRTAAAQSPSGPTVGMDRQPGVNPSAQLQLTPDQRAAILNAVRQDKAKATAPASGPVEVGAQLPPAIQLRILPDSALAQAPEAKAVQYTMIANQVVLVDPTTMRVVDIIGQ
jgi:hypothetical protein